jgi:hypothetical protein
VGCLTPGNGPQTLPFCSPLAAHGPAACGAADEREGEAGCACGDGGRGRSELTGQVLSYDPVSLLVRRDGGWCRAIQYAINLSNQLKRWGDMEQPHGVRGSEG